MTARREAGFTIVESMVALGLVFSVLIRLLAALNVGVPGVVSNPTLAADSALTGAVPDLAYTDLDPGPDEPLAPSAVDAGVAAGSTSNPLSTFSPHRWQRVSGATTYTASVYITQVTPVSGDPYKRLRGATSVPVPATRTGWACTRFCP